MASPSVSAVCVADARPNLMKVKPVMDALDLAVAPVHTGQRYEVFRSEILLAELEVRSSHRWLVMGSGTHAGQTRRVMAIFEPAPDGVLVVGGVNSPCFGPWWRPRPARWVTWRQGCTRYWTIPEEVNRLVTARVSDLSLRSIARSVDNLRAQGYRLDQVHLVGSVILDALFPTWSGPGGPTLGRRRTLGG